MHNVIHHDRTTNNAIDRGDGYNDSVIYMIEPRAVPVHGVLLGGAHLVHEVHEPGMVYTGGDSSKYRGFPQYTTYTRVLG